MKFIPYISKDFPGLATAFFKKKLLYLLPAIFFTLNIATVTVWAGSGVGEILYGDITLPPYLSDGMVLQRDIEIPLSGGCLSEQDVIGVIISNISQKTECKNGRWKVTLPAMKPGGPFEGRIFSKKSAIYFNQIYVGDVWFASGQSNMQKGADFRNGISQTEFVRVFDYSRKARLKTSAGWQPLGAMSEFGAVAGFFAHEIHKHTNFPVGIINSSKGGAYLSCWNPGSECYEQHVKTFLPFPIKGVIWWQGEEDALFVGPEYLAESYGPRFTAMIEAWRKEWRLDMPFIFVQLQRFNPSPKGRPINKKTINKISPSYNSTTEKVRFGQLEALKLKNTAMAVSFDITKGDLHPALQEKKKIANRLAIAAKSLVYGSELPFSGPIYHSVKNEGSRIVLSFSHASEGLATKNGKPLAGFELKGRNGIFKPVNAKIVGNNVVININSEKGPFIVKYAGNVYPTGNLYNKAGLPASPFITRTVF